MTNWRTLLLIARRDFMERVKSRAFQVSTALTIVLVLVVIIAPQFFANDGTEWKVAVVGVDRATVATTMSALQGSTDPVPTAVVTADSRAAAVAMLEDGDTDVVIVAGEGVVVTEGTSRTLATLAAAALSTIEITDRAAAFGLTPRQVAELLATGQAPVVSIDGEDAGAVDTQGAETLALFTTILLFVSIVTYGQWILIGVIEEKSNRVVEVVVGTVPPRLLLSGKIIGIGFLGLLQLVGVAVVALTTLKVTGVADLPETTGAVVAAAVFWFLLGFAFYATAFAAAGSLVSRQEEAQNAAFPLTLVLMTAYFIATLSVAADNPVVRVASLLPPFAPMTMPLRIALGRATGIEIVVSSVLMIAGVWALLRVAARIYRGGILRAGGKIRIREAWKSAEI